MKRLRWIGRRPTESFDARGKAWYQQLKARFPYAPGRRIERMTRIAQALKLRRGCKRCGFNEAYEALDFDHREPVTKKFNISNPPLDCTIAEFKHEVSKCDVLCANCHRIVTKQRLEINNGPKLKAKREYIKKKKEAENACTTWDDAVDARGHFRSPLMAGANAAKEKRRQEYERLHELVVNKQAMSQDRKRYFELAREFGDEAGDLKR